MVTKNFARFGSGVSIVSDDTSRFNYNIRVKDIDGNSIIVNGTNATINSSIMFTYIQEIFSRINLRSFPVPKTNQNASGSGMFFGSGITPASSDDYKLENLIEFSDTGLSVLSATLNQMLDENTLYNFVYTVKNNGTEPITISELGLISSIYYYDKNKVVTFMWARDTFDPITMEPGEIRSFTMTISV